MNHSGFAKNFKQKQQESYLGTLSSSIDTKQDQDERFVHKNRIDYKDYFKAKTNLKGWLQFDEVDQDLNKDTFLK